MVVVTSVLTSKLSNELISRCVSSLVVITRCSTSEKLKGCHNVVKIIPVPGTESSDKNSPTSAEVEEERVEQEELGKAIKELTDEDIPSAVALRPLDDDDDDDFGYPTRQQDFGPDTEQPQSLHPTSISGDSGGSPGTTRTNWGYSWDSSRRNSPTSSRNSPDSSTTAVDSSMFSDQPECIPDYEPSSRPSSSSSELSPLNGAVSHNDGDQSLESAPTVTSIAPALPANLIPSYEVDINEEEGLGEEADVENVENVEDRAEESDFEEVDVDDLEGSDEGSFGDDYDESYDEDTS